MTRTSITAGDLARRGFSDAARASQLVDELLAAHHGDQEEIVSAIAATADPDLCLSALHSLDERATTRVAEVWTDSGWLHRLIVLLGGSRELGRHLFAHPHHLEVLREPGRWEPAVAIRSRVLRTIGAAELADCSVAELGRAAITDPAAADRLRLANRAELIRIATRDLGSTDPAAIVGEIGVELADLADVIMMCAVAIARGQVPGHERVDLAVIALGKCGARELNYISDVDVCWIAEAADPETDPNAALVIATRIAAQTVRICSAHTKAGSIWQVDSGLRPEGDAGPLVRTLGAMAAYYTKWASNWEFQAMLKARPMAGDLDLGKRFCDLVEPLVWRVGEAAHFVADSQAMRERVISLIPPDRADREIKLGAGGLRDVEFSVQLLQLVHGRADERLRTAGTFAGLRTLIEHGYIGRADGAELDSSYRFQRCLEHRVQLFRMRRSHLIPDDPMELRRLARSLGIRDGDELWQQWRRSTHRVRRLQQRVFYSPLLEAVSRIPSGELRLSPARARARLHALGFSDPEAALRHIEALTQGVSRAVEIQRQLLPAMLGWFAQGANPDLGLLAFRQLSESMGATPWYLRALRDEGETAQRVARILSSSRYVGDLLRRDPATVQLLTSDDQLVPRDRPDLFASMAQVVDRHEEPETAIAAVRALRRRELFRLAVGDMAGLIELPELGRGLSDLAAATIQAAISIASADVGGVPSIGVVAMGRWGGGELSYGSDADAMFVVADGVDADGIRAAGRAVARARDLLRRPGPEPVLELDPDLRPEGRQGAMVRTVSSYLSYYQRWASTWELQALVRAAHGCGDKAVTAALFVGLDPLRWSVDGLSEEAVAEIRRIKVRVDRERLPKATDRSRNLKLGPGGLVDVEWTVQLLQLRHAGRIPALRTPSTLPALKALADNGLVTAADADILADAWRLASRLRNAIMIARGRHSDALPTDARELEAIGVLIGRQRGQASELIEQWARASRRAAQVVTRYFWEDAG